MSFCWYHLVQISGQKMKPEFKKVLHLFEELEEAGESATLTISSRKGISTIKLLLESSPPLPTASTTTPTSLPPVPGKRRRHRGAAARARRRQRAADHQASLLTAPSSPPAPGVASVPAGSHRPLHILPSPSPNSGRRRVVSCVGRLEVPTFLNLDGAPPPSLPCSPSPSTSGGWPPTKEEVVKYHRMMSKEDKCCLCEFKISDPNPQEGRLCGLLSSMWNHIEECHSEEEDWFDETFSSQFLDV